LAWPKPCGGAKAPRRKDCFRLAVAAPSFRGDQRDAGDAFNQEHIFVVGIGHCFHKFLGPAGKIELFFDFFIDREFV
jgi:hypothetical protein